VPPETAEALPAETPELDPPSDEPLEAEPDWLDELLPPLESEELELTALPPPEIEPCETPTELGPLLWIEVDWLEESPEEDELPLTDELPPEPVELPLDCWARTGGAAARTRAATATSIIRRRIFPPLGSTGARLSQVSGWSSARFPETRSAGLSSVRPE
jgi:hypothetical protein